MILNLKRVAQNLQKLPPVLVHLDLIEIKWFDYASREIIGEHQNFLIIRTLHREVLEEFLS
jgi:hypothetical protein